MLGGRSSLVFTLIFTVNFEIKKCIESVAAGLSKLVIFLMVYDYSTNTLICKLIYKILEQ